MTLVSSSIPNLINGVSQQPFTLRLASQGQEQINGLSSVVDGLKKRPPSRHVARFRTTPLSTAFTHIINRDKAEQYTLVIEGGALAVYDLQGNQKVVNTPQGIAYLATNDPVKDLAAVSVADYTFIVNKTVRVVEDGNQKAPTRPYEGLVWVKQGAYASTYKIVVDGEEAIYATGSASDAANAPTIQTSTIAANLFTQIQPKLQPKGIKVDIHGSTLYFSSTERDFGMATYDPLADTALKLVKGSVQRFTDLPARAVGGLTVRIAGTNDNNFDDYWVTYETEPTNPFGGVWKECVKPGTALTPDNATMPHLLVRDADGTFSFEEAVFEPRKAGDLVSNPWPSFVGQTIADVFFHRNRLGFLSDENITLSQAGEFFRFFKASAIQSLDTDPIDVAVSHTKVSLLRAALPFNETLMLFSDQSQFQVTKSDLLTPKTMGVNLTTQFSCNLRARPVGVGSNIYFAQKRGGFSGIREYYSDPDTAQNDAVDVTSHVPTYIPGEIRKMTASSNESVIVCLSDQTPDILYVYRFYWARQEKLQSSWSKWVMPKGSTVLDCEFIDSQLVLIISREDGCYIETINFQAGLSDGGLGYQVHLDRLRDNTTPGVLVTSHLPDPTDEGFTDVVLSHPPLEGEQYIFIAGDDDETYQPGYVLPYTRFIDTSSGQWVYRIPRVVTQFYFGVTYSFRYDFSPFIIREQAPGGQGMQAISEGRLQVRKLSLAYSATGYFRAEVTPLGRDTYKYPFAGRILASQNNKLGTTSLETGTFQFAVSSKNDQVNISIVNDNHLPCAFLSAEWEGFFTIRSKRM